MFETRLDAFYNGRFDVRQPLGVGYRSGLEALLLAAAVPPHAKGTLADIGAGTGVAGLAAASRAPALRVVLVENCAPIAALARSSLEAGRNDDLRGRIALLEADAIAQTHLIRGNASHPSGFEWVITNPPFHPPTTRPSSDRLREAALRIPYQGFVADWFVACVSLAGGNGRFVSVIPPHALGALIAVLQSSRMGQVAITPAHSRIDTSAKRVLVTAIRGSKAPLSVRPPIVLFEADGGPSELSRRISDGEARLGWPD